MATQTIELQPLEHVSFATAEPNTEPVIGLSETTEAATAPRDGAPEFSLLPADGGKDAWLFLAACFVLECLVWGFPFSFGIFQDYYRTHAPFAGSSSIAIIGTCAMGIMYLDAPIIMALGRRYPRYFRYTPPVGLFIMCIALAASSFSQTTTQLIATQGVLFAIGGSICYCPCILYMDEWFIRRKGFAFGVMWSGTGLGGCTIPLLLQFLLSKYGFRTTLRLWSVLLFVLTIPLIYFIKPRLPPSANGHMRRVNLGFVKRSPFLLYQAANIIEGVGFFLPGIYLPTYARTYLGASPFEAALTVLALNVASVGGTVAMGSLTDRMEATTCILISTIGTAIGTFLLWGFASNLALLYVFSIVYGVFAGSYTSTWPGIMKQVTTNPEESGNEPTFQFDPIMVFGLLAAGRGVGNVVSGPVSEMLINGLPWQGQAAAGYGSGYGPLIAFTGVSAIIGGGSFVWKRLGWL